MNIQISNPSVHRLLILGSLFCWLLTDRQAIAGADLAALTAEVRLHEARFEDCCADVYVVSFEDRRPLQATAAELRHILQWRTCYYESICNRELSPDLARPKFRFTVCNGEEMTVYTPPDRVVKYAGQFGRPGKFRPHAVLLATMGYQGTVSTLLSSTAEPGTDFIVETANTETRNGLKTVSLRAIRQVPGQPPSGTLELHLAVDHDFLPFGGKLVEGDTVDNQRTTECTSSFEITPSSAFSLRQRIRSRTHSEGALEASEESRVVHLNVSALSSPPRPEMFQLKGYVGHPDVSVYENFQLKSSESTKKGAEKRDEWPPYFTWLFINDAAIGGYLLFRCVRFIVRRAREVRPPRAATAVSR